MARVVISLCCLMWISAEEGEEEEEERTRAIFYVFNLSSSEFLEIQSDLDMTH